MKLYRNKKRGPRELLGETGRVPWATIKVRVMTRKELYPPGPMFQINFNNCAYSIELTPAEAQELFYRLQEFTDEFRRYL